MDRTSGLNRREVMGSVAAAGLAAAGGRSRAAQGTPADTTVVSVHLDVPFMKASGGAYRAPMRSAAEAGLVDPHELA